MHSKEIFNPTILQPRNESIAYIPLRGPDEAIIKALDGFTEISFALSEPFAKLLKLILEDYKDKSKSKTLQKYSRNLTYCNFLNTRFKLTATPIDLKHSLFIGPTTDKIIRDEGIKSVVIILDVPKQCYAPNFLEGLPDSSIYPLPDLHNILRHLPPSVTHININWLALTAKWGPVPISPSPDIVALIPGAHNSRNQQSNNTSADHELQKLNAEFNLLKQELELIKQERNVLIEESVLMKEKLQAAHASNAELTAGKIEQQVELSATQKKLRHSEEAHGTTKEYAATLEKELALKTQNTTELVDGLYQTIATHRLELSETQRQLFELKAKSGDLQRKLLSTELKLQKSEKSTRMHINSSAIHEDLTKVHSNKHEHLKEKYLSLKRKHKTSLAELVVKNRALEAKNNQKSEEESSTKPRSKKRRTQRTNAIESRPPLAAGAARFDQPSAGQDGIPLEERYNAKNY